MSKKYYKTSELIFDWISFDMVQYVRTDKATKTQQ